MHDSTDTRPAPGAFQKMHVLADDAIIMQRSTMMHCRRKTQGRHQMPNISCAGGNVSSDTNVQSDAANAGQFEKRRLKFPDGKDRGAQCIVVERGYKFLTKPTSRVTSLYTAESSSRGQAKVYRKAIKPKSNKYPATWPKPSKRSQFGKQRTVPRYRSSTDSGTFQHKSWRLGSRRQIEFRILK